MILTGDQVTLEETVAFARRAEEANFDSVWVTELWRDAFVPLSAIAVATERIRLGSAVALTMARSPVLMELAAAGVDELSKGRLVLGIGAGPRVWNENWHSVPFYPPAAHLQEYADVLRLMWSAHSGKSVHYPGKYLKIQGYQRYNVPYREKIPIYFGSVIPPSLRATGAAADGLCIATLHTPRYISDVARPEVEAGKRAAGRQDKKLEFVTLLLCSVDADGKKARERVKGQIAYYSTFRYYDAALNLHPVAEETARIREASARGDTAGMIGAVSEQMVDLIALAGTPEEVREAAQRYEGLVDEINFYTPTLGLSRAEVLANHEAILTAFRR
jgi:alkanesulfonate monooxygenase SsuD/methylene tetrahydromethanopterin reductase-like flavin-dependent oxidoreductase (luciferase family)